MPSGRGCVACRQQKKKVRPPTISKVLNLVLTAAQCDTTVHPCPRCKRLNIPCIGHGQRRYKFVHDDKTSPQGDSIIQKGEFRSEVGAESTPTFNAVKLFQPPSNATTLLVAAFTEKIKPTRGIKFNMAWTYGDYLNSVPSRLGVNEALDAATDTFVTAVEISLCKRGTDQTSILLEKYGRTLACLRTLLNDPVKAKAPETLCAILFLWNCQVILLALPAQSCPNC